MRSILALITLASLSFMEAQAQDNPLAGFSSLAHSSPPDVDETSRYAGMVEFGYLYGKASNNMNTSVASPTVQFFNGLRVHRSLAVGATVGFDFYDNVLVTPFSLGLRGELTNTRVSPFYSIDAGYGSTTLNDDSDQRRTSGGLMFNPALGIRVRTGNNTALTFAGGYKQQQVSVENNWWNNRSNEGIKYKRLVLRMGFMF